MRGVAGSGRFRQTAIARRDAEQPPVTRRTGGDVAGRAADSGAVTCAVTVDAVTGEIHREAARRARRSPGGGAGGARRKLGRRGEQEARETPPRRSHADTPPWERQAGRPARRRGRRDQPKR